MKFNLLPERHKEGLVMLAVFCGITGMFFSIFWSLQDQAINLWPLVYLGSFWVFGLILAFLFRNNL